MKNFPGFLEVKRKVTSGQLSRDEAWDIGMEHPDWDTGCEIRGFIIDLNEADAHTALSQEIAKDLGEEY